MNVKRDRELLLLLLLGSSYSILSATLLIDEKDQSRRNKKICWHIWCVYAALNFFLYPYAFRILIYSYIYIYINLSWRFFAPEDYGFRSNCYSQKFRWPTVLYTVLYFTLLYCTVPTVLMPTKWWIVLSIVLPIDWFVFCLIDALRFFFPNFFYDIFHTPLSIWLNLLNSLLLSCS